MKKILSISILLLLVSMSELFAVIQPIPDKAVGAPLDGGLLALLAGAGIAYFAGRKKKKKLD